MTEGTRGTTDLELEKANAENTRLAEQNATLTEPVYFCSRRSCEAANARADCESSVKPIKAIIGYLTPDGYVETDDPEVANAGVQRYIKAIEDLRLELAEKKTELKRQIALQKAVPIVGEQCARCHDREKPTLHVGRYDSWLCADCHVRALEAEIKPLERKVRKEQDRASLAEAERQRRMKAYADTADLLGIPHDHSVQSAIKVLQGKLEDLEAELFQRNATLGALTVALESAQRDIRDRESIKRILSDHLKDAHEALERGIIQAEDLKPYPETMKRNNGDWHVLTGFDLADVLGCLSFLASAKTSAPERSRKAWADLSKACERALNWIKAG